MAQTQRVLTELGSLTPSAASPVQSAEPGTLDIVSSRCGPSKSLSRPAVDGMVRPTGVTIIAVLMFLGAAFLALGSLAFFFVGGMAMTGGDAGELMSAVFAGMGMSGGIFFLLLASVYAVLAIDLLKLLNWARLACMAVIVIGTLVAIGVFASIAHLATAVVALQLLVIALEVWVVWYLVRPHVQQAFGATPTASFL
jgi:hypothetical protein